MCTATSNKNVRHTKGEEKTVVGLTLDDLAHFNEEDVKIVNSKDCPEAVKQKLAPLLVNVAKAVMANLTSAAARNNLGASFEPEHLLTFMDALNNAILLFAVGQAGTPIAFLTGDWNSTVANIHFCLVHPRHAGAGLGTKLVQEALVRLMSRGTTECSLLSVNGSSGFYAGMDFKNPTHQLGDKIPMVFTYPKVSCLLCVSLPRGCPSHLPCPFVFCYSP